MIQLEEDVQLMKFKLEYEKLYRSFVRSVTVGCRLFDQYSQLHHSYYENIHSSKLLSDSTVHDEQMIRNLKSQIKRGNEYLESSHLKEEKSKDELRLLKAEVQDLKTNLQQGVTLSVVQEKNIHELMKTKEDALKELEYETERINLLRSKMSDLSTQIQQQEIERRHVEQENTKLRSEIETRKLYIDAELRNKENLEIDLRDHRQTVSMRIAEVKQKQDALTRCNEDILLLQNQSKSQRQISEKLMREHDDLISKETNIKQTYDEQMAITALAHETLQTLIHDLQKKEAEKAKWLDQFNKAKKIKDGILKKTRQLENKRMSMETTLKNLHEDEADMHVKMDEVHVVIEEQKHTLEEMVREKAMLTQNLTKMTSETELKKLVSSILSQTQVNLEQECSQCEKSIHKLNQKFLGLQKDKEKYEEKIRSIHHQAMEMVSSLKKHEAEIYQYKKKVVESECKLKHQQNLYDTVEADRNLHAKNLIERQAEITKLKRHLKIMNFQINGLKEEIQSKEEQLQREVAEREKLEKETSTLEEEIKNLKHQNDLAQMYMREQMVEESRLGQFVKEAETEKHRQEHILNLVLSERDQLSSQLIKQENELVKVYDGIKALQFGLLKSEKHYFQKLKQKSVMKREICKGMHTLKRIELEIRDYSLLHQAIHQLKAAMVHEQGHIKFLMDGIECPINIHRWRRLEGSDSGLIARIHYVHDLQKTSIKKYKEDQRQESLVHEKEARYIQLKEIQNRQLGPEVLEQVNELEMAVYEKNNQLKHMNVELEMYRAKIKENKYILSGMQRQAKELKAMYFESKKYVAKPTLALLKSSSN
ncbi:hypothetical protein HMI55_001426 [Coelomomyces lativittatus]|nr:hypothetical protein HMI55_001426 [Coelomomyces lativittatus]